VVTKGNGDVIKKMLASGSSPQSVVMAMVESGMYLPPSSDKWDVVKM
jgi:hypothetical protein